LVRESAGDEPQLPASVEGFDPAADTELEVDDRDVAAAGVDAGFGQCGGGRGEERREAS
jgi:hypothetical protein